MGKKYFNEKVEKLSKPEFKDLCENLQNGIAISTPVFDGAKEKNVTEMLELANLTRIRTNIIYGTVEQVKNLIDL